jgi:hypothetical protein
MTAVPAIVEAIHAAGLTLTATPDGRVKIVPADRLTGELADLIRANKPALVDWLQAANDPGPGDPARWCWPAVQDLDAPMNPGEVETFTARMFLLMRFGMKARRAEELADKLKRRDRQGDDRRACIECQRLNTARVCTAWRQAAIGGPQVGRDLLTLLQRCPAFLK